VNVRIFFVFLLIGIWVGVSTTQAQFLRGDVNGDGSVNGKDALLLLRMIEGLEPMTEQAKKAGDIYPVNGTGERPFGDGQLTREDVRQILRIIVGAIPLGEITGKFEPPLIEDFSPRIGSIGAEVTIKGSNFIGGDLGRSVMIILFGGVPATTVMPISSTEVKVIVPEGATSSHIIVTTPGGEARSDEPFLVQEIAEGEISLPSSFNVTDVDVVSTAGEGNSDGNGNFSVPTVSGRTTLMSVIPRDKPNNAFLSLLPPSNRHGGTPRVDARSTAEALVLMQPLFATVNGDLFLNLQRKLDSLPELDSLSQVVEQVWSDSDDPFNDERLGPPLKVAVLALADSLSSLSSGGRKVHTPASSSRSSARTFFNADAKFLSLKFEGDSVEASLEFGSPVDWFVRIARLDLKKLPDSISSLRADEVYARLDFSDTTFLPATRVTSEIIGAIIPIVLNAIPKSVPGTIGATGEAAGLLPSEGRLSLESNVDHAVYVVRAFSGILFSSGGSDSATIARLPYGRGDELTALITNIVVAAWEVANVYVPILSAIPPSVGGEIIRQVILVIHDEIETLMSQSSSSSQGVASSPSRVGDLADKVYRIVAKTLQEIIEQLRGRVPERMQAVLKNVSAQVVSVADVAAKVAGILPVAERVAGIAGLQIPGLNLLELTPLETSFIIVGNPFGAAIVDFTPKEGKPGDTVKIEGIGFDANPQNNQVFFGKVQAKVLEVRKYVPTSFASDGDIIVVEVPVGVEPWEVSVSIQIPGAKMSVADDRFKMMRLPIIESVSPTKGFAATDGTFGQYSGTRVEIRGRLFQPREDKVFFGGIEAEVLPPPASSSEILTVRVPKGAKSGKVMVKTPDGLVAKSPETFTVIGSPTLSRILPTQARAGEKLILTGTNFASTDREIKVQYQLDGKWEEIPAATLISSTELVVNMPSVGEGKQTKLRVITPAGSSNAMAVTQLRGKREFGAGLHPTKLEGIEPDGVLTFEEALNFVQGRADIFSSEQGWDDVDHDVVIKRVDVYKFISEDTNDDGKVEPGEGFWKFDRTIYELISDDPRASRGHRGVEWAYVTERHYERKGKEKLLGESQYTVSMDGQDESIHGIKIEGMGKIEEGDLIVTDHIGRNFADVISLRPPQGTTLPSIHLDEQLAGDDRIYIETEENAAVLNGDIVVNSNGNTIMGNILVKGKLVIRGNRNHISRFYQSDMIAVEQGVVVDGSSRNVIKYVKSISTDIGFKVIGEAIWNDLEVWAEDCAVGCELSSGATHNTVISWVSNCNVGVKLLGEGTRFNHVEVFDEQGYTSVTGVEISDGANGNFIRVNRLAGDGIVVKGKGTSGNVLVATRNKGNGVHLMQGASKNTIGLSTSATPTIAENGKHGVLIEGKGTDNNRIQGQVVHNGKAGVYIKGGGSQSPLGTVIQNAIFSENGTVGLLVENVQGGNTPSVSVNDCDFHPRPGIATHTSTPAIILDNSSHAVLKEISISSHDVGLVITGSSAVNNEITNLNVPGDTSIAVHLKDHASSNRLLKPNVFGTQYCILIEEGASKNFIGSSGSSKGVIQIGNVGIMIRGGAHDNVVSGIGFSSKGGYNAVVIEGTSGNVIEGSSFKTCQVVVQNGASNVRIGSFVPGLENYFSSYPSNKIQQHVGIVVRGAATHDITIAGYTIRDSKEAIVVENARNVRIGLPRETILVEGVEQSAVANMIYNCKVGVRLAGAQNVLLEGTEFLNNEVGLLITDGSADITVGGLREAKGNIFEAHDQIAIHVTGADSQRVHLLNNRLVPVVGLKNRVGIALDGGVKDVEVRGNTISSCKEDGIQITGGLTQGNVIENNTVDHNGRHGVYVAGGARLNTIRNNSIYGNGGQGIALDGGNDSLPSPTFTSYVPATRQVAGIVPDSVPVGSTVEIFGDAKDEGKLRLGVANVRAGRDFLTRLYKHLPPGMNLTATVTDPQGNTSEFSDRFEPIGRRPPNIVFTTTRLGNRDIYRLFAGEQVGVQLTTDPAVDRSPALSPDRQQVAFVSDRSGNPDVWLMGSGGANPQNLTNHPAADLDPAWSPDGEKIAFVSDRDGNLEIFVMDADGGNLRQLTQTDGVVNLHPTWSPDGGKIAFARGQMAEGGQIVASEIFIMSADGSNPVNITNHAANDGRPAWSPDGGDIAFVSDRDGNAEIYLMKPDGSNIRRLTEDTAVDTDPAWVSDGQLLFSSNRVRDFEVYIMTRDGSNPIRVTLSLGINIQPNAGLQ